MRLRDLRVPNPRPVSHASHRDLCTSPALRSRAGFDLTPSATVASPADTTAIEATVHSIFGFIRRTGKPATIGRSWQTIDYDATNKEGILTGVTKTGEEITGAGTVRALHCRNKP